LLLGLKRKERMRAKPGDKIASFKRELTRIKKSREPNANEAVTEPFN